jgi:hypothetical protein
LSSAIQNAGKVQPLVPRLLAAVAGFWAATMPAPASRRHPVTASITIPVPADIMADLTVADITAADLMAVAAVTAGIEPSNHAPYREMLFYTNFTN